MPEAVSNRSINESQVDVEMTNRVLLEPCSSAPASAPPSCHASVAQNSDRSHERRIQAR
jgi:hypothetical protein